MTTAPTSLADWSPWLPFADACKAAPTKPGVYLARESPDGPIVYVGKAEERKGHGLRGRLHRYRGKALASGLGEAVMDRALADPVWLRERLAEVEQGRPMQATAWKHAAFARADLQICWATTPDGRSATELEARVMTEVDHSQLWNVRKPAPSRRQHEQGPAQTNRGQAGTNDPSAPRA